MTQEEKKLTWQEQIKLVREEQKRKQEEKQRQEEFAKEEIKIQELAIRNEELLQVVMNNLRNKYWSYFSTNRRVIAGRIITNFFRKFLSSDPSTIPGLYRFRMKFTNHHLHRYHESAETLEEYKQLHINEYEDVVINLFDKYYDIRDMIQMKNDPLVVCDIEFWLQPKDHDRLNRLWKKLNGETTQSIRFITNMEYHRALCKDRNWTDFYKETPKLEIKEEVKEVKEEKLDNLDVDDIIMESEEPVILQPKQIIFTNDMVLNQIIKMKYHV